MNERIKELMNDAVLEVEDIDEHGETFYWTTFDREKFAELIVNECIGYCGENLSKTVGQALKIHFGLK